MSHCTTDWNLIREKGEVSAWHSPYTGWLAIGINPDWADSWIIGRPSAELILDGKGELDRVMELWLAGPS